MSAPDKIYLNYPKEETDADIATWDTKTFDDCENTCYIRKDYLLKLIEEEAKFWDDGEMIFRRLKKELNEI